LTDWSVKKYNPNAARTQATTSTFFIMLLWF
jgi:hypothetical protein